MLKQLKQAHTNNSLGLTAQTAQMREDLCTLAMKCANALSAFAAATKNLALLNKIGYTDSMLRKLKNAELSETCGLILEEAAAHITEAGAFGYRQEDINALKQYLEQYASYLQTNSERISKKKNLESLLHEFSLRRNRAA